MVTPASSVQAVAAGLTEAVHRVRGTADGPAVLRDPEMDRRLRRDGFVKVPFLTRSEAGDLRAEYGRLHGWEGEGFEVDFWNPELPYRAAASAALDGATAAAVARVFADHVPFLRNYLVKWPGLRPTDGFPEGPHRDWMYTDERAGQRSYVIWIALEDVDHHNGQLQVARGSHVLDDRLRGTNIATPWLDHAEVWAERMLTVPARCGEAIITDAATVHGSLSNLTSQPRVAAAVAVRPAGAPLVHFRQVDEDRAARFSVDDDFFITQPAPLLLQQPPDLPIDAIVDVGGRDLDPEELARELDRQPLAVVDRTRRAARRLVGRVRS